MRLGVGGLTVPAGTGPLRLAALVKADRLPGELPEVGLKSYGTWHHPALLAAGPPARAQLGPGAGVVCPLLRSCG